MTDKKYVMTLRNADAEGEWRRIGEFRTNLRGLIGSDDPVMHKVALALVTDGHTAPLTYEDWRHAYFIVTSLVPGGETPVHYFYSQYADREV